MPSDPLAYFNRAAVYEDKGMKTEALIDFKRSIELATDDDFFVDTAKWRVEVLEDTIKP